MNKTDLLKLKIEYQLRLHDHWSCLMLQRINRGTGHEHLVDEADSMLCTIQAEMRMHIFDLEQLLEKEK